MYNVDNLPFKIWYKKFDDRGNEVASGVYHKEYKNYGSALNRARLEYGYDSLHQDGSKATGFIARVCWRDPWVEYSREVECDICKKHYDCPENIDGILRPKTIYCSDRMASRRHKEFMLCPECYDKITNFINGLIKVKE